MRVSLVPLVLVALVVGGVQAEVFRSPAQVNGDLSVEQADWLLLLIDPDTGSLAADLDVGPGQQINRTHRWIDIHASPVGSFENPVPDQEPKVAATSAARLRLTPHTGPGWLYVEAAQVQLEATTARASLNALVAGSCRWSLVPQTLMEAFPPRDPSCQSGAQVAFVLDPTSLRFNVTGLRSLEWFNIHAGCEAPPCPPPGGASRTAIASVGASAWVRSHSWTQLLAPGSMLGTAQVVAAYAGSASLDFTIDGMARLPLADCQSCQGGAGTLVLGGQLEFTNVTTADGGTLQAEVAGNILASRRDEQTVSWQAGAAAGLGALALFGLLRWLLALGALRVNPKDALDHPNRQRIHDHVAAHPGATFSEIRRQAGLAVGPTRHHLNVMVRGGWLRVRQHANTLRYFTSDNPAADLAEVVLLRDVNLAHLHAWLEQYPGSPQGAVVAAAGDWGWKRGTTQYRLKKLVASGVVHELTRGRTRTYWTRISADASTTHGASPSAVAGPVAQASDSAAEP